MKKHNRGFTLIELLIAIAIIGILAGIGYPAYTKAVKKSERADAIEALLSLAGRMEEHYLNNDTYATANITTLMGSTSSKEGLYTLSFNPAPTAFKYDLVATPVVADPECGNLTLNSLGVKGVSIGTVDGCW